MNKINSKSIENQILKVLAADRNHTGSVHLKEKAQASGEDEAKREYTKFIDLMEASKDACSSQLMEAG